MAEGTWRFNPGEPCCGGLPDCVACDNGAPAQLQLDFTNVANNTCSECVAYWSNPFILDRDGGNTCLYKFNDDFVCDCTDTDRVYIGIQALWTKIVTTYHFTVNVIECDCCAVSDVGLATGLFRKSWGSIPDCTFASPTLVPVFETAFWTDQACEWDDTIVTCTVTAI